MLLVGHSFGSATVLRYVRQSSEQQQSVPYKGFLLADLWPDPLIEQDVTTRLPAPFSALMSEHWVETPAYMKAHQSLIEANPKTFMAAASIRGTSHQWISESQLIGPAWLLRKMGLMGPAPYAQVYRASAQLVDLALQAMLADEEHRRGLHIRWKNVDPSLVRLEWVGTK